MTVNSVWPTSLRLSLVGAGRVGSSIAHWARHKGAKLVEVASRSDSASRLVTALGGRATAIDRLDSSDTDLLVIAVADSAIASVAESLSRRPQAPVVLHTSGRLDASPLASLRERGSSVGTLHPLMAFAEVSTSVENARSVVFAIDGDPRAVELATRLVGGLEGHPIRIDSQVRSLYHLAATIAAGGVTTLLAEACQLAENLGIDPAVRRGYLRLAEGAIAAAAESDSIADAITGPVARGEISDYRDQVESLRAVDPDLAALVELLAQRTERLTRRSRD